MTPHIGGGDPVGGAESGEVADEVFGGTAEAIEEEDATFVAGVWLVGGEGEGGLEGKGGVVFRFDFW